MSLFSGAGGFDLGFQNAGHTIVGQVENDKHCQKILHRHWPDIPKWEDIHDVNGAELPDFDILIFGSPCQNLSVSGNRQGLEGEKSKLFYQATRIIKEYKNSGRNPTWVIWENVIGALYSNNGHDFANVIDSLADSGAVDIQWRSLDAQYFGIPQRRRRVFVLASYDPRTQHRPEILPLPHSLRRNPPQSSQTRPQLPPTNPTSPPTNSQPTLPQIANELLQRDYKGVPTYVDKHAYNLIPIYSIDSNAGNQAQTHINQTPPIKPGNTDGMPHPPAITTPTGLRRITPLEAERLMGWPDNWTQPNSDKQRYKMIGNGVATPVAQWIAQHIG